MHCIQHIVALVLFFWIGAALPDPLAFRHRMHALDPELFSANVPPTPFTDETHFLRTHDVLVRFGKAAGLALLQDACHSIEETPPMQLDALVFARQVCQDATDSVQTPPLALVDVLVRLQTFLEAHPRPVTAGPQDPPYFGFIPKYLGAVLPAQDVVVFGTTPCNSTIGVSVALNETTGVVRIDADAWRSGGNSSGVCVDDLLLTVGPKSTAIRIEGTGSYSATVAVAIQDPAYAWDAQTNGVRVFRYHNSDVFTRLLDTIDTLLLFLPMLTGHLDPASAVANVRFLSNYSLMTPYPEPRPFPYVVNVSAADDIHSGDLFAKMDLNGLGPIEAFAQGTTSGHTAIAIRNTTTGVLFVCESVEQGITCTEYPEWIDSMQAAGSNIVMAPLNASLRALFNVTEAWMHIHRFLGNEYGYFNFFFGWVDTEEDNYPCMPWEWDRCLTSALVEYVMLFLDASVPEVASTFFGQALNHRAATGVLNMSIANVLHLAGTQRSLSAKQLMTIPENDTWLYNSTKRGVPGRQLLPSEVCSSFACSTLRAGGVFEPSIGSNITCTEIDVWDIFAMKMFDTSRMGPNRPAPCVAADPNNNLCQLSGTWTFALVEDANTRPLQPQMSLHCASQNPVPYNRDGC